MPTSPKPDPVKICEHCGAAFTRRRFGDRLEDRTRFLARKFCSQSCANSKKKEVVKSTQHWRARKIAAPGACQDCGTREKVHVHHIDRNPANNDPANLADLCASCHLKLHWREDREKRLAAMRRRSTGASTSRRSGAGK